MGKKFYNFMRGVLYVPYKVIFPAKIIGRERFPKTNRMITVSNHLSWLDIPTVGINISGFRHFVAKKELGNNKAIYKLALMLGVIFIDRSKPDMNAIRSGVGVLKAGEGLSIFPEGTRNKTDEALHEIKGGVTMLALKGNAPIVPILIHHRTRAFRKNYVYIGQPFDLKSFDGRRLDSDTLAEAGGMVLQQMQTAKQILDDYVADKGWIAEKQQKNARRKAQKIANKQARRDYKTYLTGRKKIGNKT